MPLTFRLLFHGVRSLWIACVLAVIVWLTLVPPTLAERNALGNSPFQQTGVALAQMRIARLVVHFAPDRAATMLSNASNGEISPELAGMLLRQIASGPVGLETEMQTISPPAQERSVGGAKFVTVDD